MYIYIFIQTYFAVDPNGNQSYCCSKCLGRGFLPQKKGVVTILGFKYCVYHRENGGTLGMVHYLFNHPKEPFKRGYTQ